MSKNVMDKIKRMKQRQASKGGNFSKTTGIFHNFDQPESVIRLLGSFLQVNVHFIAPSKMAKLKSRGICPADAFDRNRDNKLPMMINCLNWDLEKEEWKKDKICPVCRLNTIAYKALKEGGLSADDKKFFESLKADSRTNTKLKWNILDRDDPFVTQTDEDGNKTQVLGVKIANIGMQAWGDIEKIFDQVGFDITDSDEGIDIKVIRTDGQKTSYSAQAVLEGRNLKVTPLTDEERELKPHDLIMVCGKQTEREQILEFMHDDLRELLNEVDGGSDDPIDRAIDETVADDDPPPARKVPKKQAKKPAPVEEDDGADDLGDDDPF